MTFKETLEKVESSNEFKDFKKQNENAELVAGFFIIDFISNDNKKSLDYLSGEKIYTFDFLDNGKVKFREDELIEKTNQKLTQISKEISVELDELKSIAGTRILDEGISAKFNKIIAILQNNKDKQVWNLTCMLDGLIIINILIDANAGEIIKFERKSMMDLIRKK